MVTKETVRKCVACNTKQDRSIFIRVMQEHQSGEYIVSPSNKQFGRSIYLCNNADCVAKLQKHKKYKDKINFDLLTQIKAQSTKYDGRWKN